MLDAEAYVLIQTLQEAGISKSIDLDKLKMMLSLYAHGEGRDSLITNVKEFTNDVVQVRITGNGYKERRCALFGSVAFRQVLVIALVDTS